MWLGGVTDHLKGRSMIIDRLIKSISLELGRKLIVTNYIADHSSLNFLIVFFITGSAMKVTGTSGQSI
jgi:hypothetical protein